jgi:hypothetical protein
MGTAPGHGEYDDNTLIRTDFKFDTPITDPTTQYSISPLEEFYVPVIWVGSHVLESIVDVLKIGARYITKVARCGLSYFEAPCHVSIDRAKRIRHARRQVALRLLRRGRLVLALLQAA